jgi:hypothetical protein
MTERDETPEDMRIGRLYRRGATEEPSAEIDRAVLAAARAAIPRRRYRTPIPWAVAATLVLGVGIGWQVLQFSQVQVHPASVPADEVDSEIPGQAAVPAPVPESSNEAARAGAPANLAPQWMLREAMPAKKAPLDAERAVPFSSTAPAVSSSAGSSECGAYGLAQDAPLQGWLDAIETARQAGDTVQVRCLEQLLRKREASSAKPAGIPRSESDR